MVLRVKRFIALIVALNVTAAALADDWPGWRGPRGDGISHEMRAPLKWSPTENIAWKTPIPGVGLSSPIIVGDRVFVTSGIAEDQSRHLICLSRDQGVILWDRRLLNGPPGQMHRFNTTASSTPVCDGDAVYAAFTDDTGLSIFAVTVEGKLSWSKRVGDFYSNHGFAASPVLFENGVILNGQQDGQAFIVCLNCLNGEELWRYTPAMNLRSFSTPVLVEHEGLPQIIVTGSSQTVAIDAKLGKLIWFASGPTEKFVCTPSVGHGLVYSFGGSPDKKSMAVRMGGTGDVTQSHIEWRNERSMPYVPSPLLLGDDLHIVNDQGVYTCLHAKSGKVLMSSRKFGNVYSSPIAVADHVYFFEDSGACTVIKAGSNFDEVGHNDLKETIQTTPAISDGRLFVRSESHLFCIVEK